MEGKFDLSQWITITILMGIETPETADTLKILK